MIRLTYKDGLREVIYWVKALNQAAGRKVIIIDAKTFREQVKKWGVK